jgi:hypothetical protein
MDAQGDAADLGTALQEQRQRVATIDGMVLLCDALDVVVHLRAVELVAVGPQPDLEVQAAPHGLPADELQRFEIALALRRGQFAHPHLMARNGKQERIGEVQINVAHLHRVVVLQAERHAEPVEAVGRQHRQILAPHRAIMEPALVLDIALKAARNAAHAVGRLLHDRMGNAEHGDRIGAVADAVGELGDGVGKPARIVAGGEQDRSVGIRRRDERERLRHRRDGRAGPPQQILCGRRGDAGDPNAGGGRARLIERARHLDRDLSCREGLAQLFRSPAGGCDGGNRITRIDNQRNAALCGRGRPDRNAEGPNAGRHGRPLEKVASIDRAPSHHIGSSCQLQFVPARPFAR